MDEATYYVLHNNAVQNMPGNRGSRPLLCGGDECGDPSAGEAYSEGLRVQYLGFKEGGYALVAFIIFWQTSLFGRNGPELLLNVGTVACVVHACNRRQSHPPSATAAACSSAAAAARIDFQLQVVERQPLAVLLLASRPPINRA